MQNKVIYKDCYYWHLNRKEQADICYKKKIFFKDGLECSAKCFLPKTKRDYVLSEEDLELYNNSIEGGV